MDWSLIGAGNAEDNVASNVAAINAGSGYENSPASFSSVASPARVDDSSGFGNFLIGTGMNVISRVVDQEFPGATRFNDPVALGKAESSGSVFIAGRPAAANAVKVAGFSLSPMVLWVAGFLGLSLLLVVVLRK